MAAAIGRRQGSISDVERGRNSVDGITHLLKLACRANPDWLKTGNGEMFLPGDPLKGRGSPAAGLPGTGEKNRLSGEHRMGVPYFNQELHRGGPGGEMRQPSLVSEPPEYYIDFKPFNDCTAYYPYRGESMYPKFLHGDIIAVKEVNNPDIILWGEAYLVITDAHANSLKTVRILKEHRNKSKVVLTALNPAFSGDIVIDKKSIISLHLVKGKISMMI